MKKTPLMQKSRQIYRLPDSTLLDFCAVSMGSPLMPIIELIEIDFKSWPGDAKRKIFMIADFYRFGIAAF